MCDPFTLMAVGSGVLKAGGALIEGQQKSAAAKLQAQIAEGNAAALRAQARIQEAGVPLANIRASFDIGKVARAGEASIGNAVASFGAGGIDHTFGSPLLLIGHNAAQAETDEALIGARGASEKADRLAQVAQTVAGVGGAVGQGIGFRQQASNALTAGIFGAGTALLNTASSVWPGLPTGGGGAAAGGFTTKPSGLGFGFQV